MGCQTEVDLGASLTFTITTHDPDTGILTDADAPPTYRVYEDEGLPPLLAGAMAFLDPANTVGFYSEQIAVTAAAGFEANRSYNIYVEATVDGEQGGMNFAFEVLAVIVALAAKVAVGDAPYPAVAASDDP